MNEKFIHGRACVVDLDVTTWIAEYSKYPSSLWSLTITRNSEHPNIFVYLLLVYGGLWG